MSAPCCSDTGLDTRLCPCTWCNHPHKRVMREIPDPIAARVVPPPPHFQPFHAPGDTRA